jgi:RNA polymerase sigma-70 factor (ECF subfamily)
MMTPATMRPSPAERSLDNLSDKEMAERIAAGDTAAFRSVMTRHNQSLFRAARSILRDDAEAEDAVQEGYLLAYGAMGSFRGDARLSTWLMRIIVNEALGRSRKNKRTAEVIVLDSTFDEDAPAAQTTMTDNPEHQPERMAVRAETRRLIEARIDALPDAFRTVFVLRAVQEMSVEEVAASLSIPEATVRTRFFRARALLRESLSREMDHALEEAFAFAGERCNRITERVLARIAAVDGKHA